MAKLELAASYVDWEVIPFLAPMTKPASQDNSVPMKAIFFPITHDSLGIQRRAHTNRVVDESHIVSNDAASGIDL